MLSELLWILSVNKALNDLQFDCNKKEQKYILSIFGKPFRAVAVIAVARSLEHKHSNIYILYNKENLEPLWLKRKRRLMA